ncbi:MAG: ABC transporter ATP-binding protein, partial [Lachnospiraceae bacterium]
MKTVIKYLKPHFPRMTVGFVIKFTGTVMDLLLPYILAYIIDEVVLQKDINKILLWGLLMILCAFLALVCNIVANRMASAVARDTTYELRKDLFGKISGLSCAQVDDISESSLISRMTSDTYNIHNAIGRVQRMGVRAPILLIGGICLTMTLDRALALILVATLPFLLGTVWVVTRKGIPLYTDHEKAVDKMVGKVRESIYGIRVIKALSKIDYEMERFNDNNEEVSFKEEKAGVIMAITNPVMNFLLNMGWVMIIIAGAYRVNLGLTMPGIIIAFLTYFTIILNAMLSITKIFVLLSKAGASANRIEEILNCDDDLQVVKEMAGESGGDFISFENVSFSYNHNKPNVSDITFGIEKGKTLGIIGSTGSGKSTLIQLLLRFYDVDSGSIKISGKDIR